MPNYHDPNTVVTGLFREVVLVLGGVFAMRGTDDQTVRQVAQGLAEVWRRAQHRQNEPTRTSTLSPHPAIAELLRATRTDRPRPPSAHVRRRRGSSWRPNRRGARHGR